MSLRSDDHAPVYEWLRAVEAKALPAMRFSGAGGGSHALWWGSLDPLPPGAKTDYAREAGDLWRNSVVAAAIGWLQDNFATARPQVCRVAADGVATPVPGHRMIALLKRPNPGYSARALWAATVLSYKVDGNAYWIKARTAGGTGAPGELWWVPHWQIEPRWDASGDEFIGWYEYTVDGRTYRLQPSDVVHFRDGLDPHNPRKGCSRLKHGIRNIVGLNRAETYTAAVVAMGATGGIVSPGDAKEEFDEDEGQAVVRSIRAATSGENAGQYHVISVPVKFDRPNLGPQELALDTILDRPSATVCALIGPNSMVLGLPDNNRTFSNLQEAERQAWSNGLIPMQEAMADDLEHQLLGDFSSDPAEEVGWDRSKVEALQRDATERANEAVTIRGGGLASLNEARNVYGLPPIDGGDTSPALEAEQARQQAAAIGGGGDFGGDNAGFGDDGEGEGNEDFGDDDTMETKAARRGQGHHGDGGHDGPEPGRKPKGHASHRRSDKPPVDGDHDGRIYDGTSRERPAPAAPSGALSDQVKARFEEAKADAKLPKGYEAKLEISAPQTKAEERLMARAHAAGKEAMVVKSEPKYREEIGPDGSKYYVGDKVSTSVHQVQADDPETPWLKKGEWVNRHPGPDGKHRDFPHKTRAAAERDAKKDALAGLRSAWETQTDRFLVRRLDRFTFEDHFTGDHDATTITFRVLRPKGND